MKKCKHCHKPMNTSFTHYDTKLTRCTPTATRQYGYSADAEGQPCNTSCIMFGKEEPSADVPAV